MASSATPSTTARKAGSTAPLIRFHLRFSLWSRPSKQSCYSLLLQSHLAGSWSKVKRPKQKRRCADCGTVPLTSWIFKPNLTKFASRPGSKFAKTKRLYFSRCGVEPTFDVHCYQSALSHSMLRTGSYYLKQIYLHGLADSCYRSSWINIYTVYFLQIAGIQKPFQYSILVAAVGLIGVLISLLFVRSVGRRTLMIVGTLGCGICQLIPAIVWSVDPGSKSSGKIVVAFICLFELFFVAYCEWFPSLS